MNSIQIQEEIIAPRKIVWDYIFNSSHREKWWAKEIVLSSIIGSEFIEPWIDSNGKKNITRGHVLEVIPMQTFALTWADQNWNFETIVRFDFANHNKICQLNIFHTGWELAPKNQRDTLMKAHQEGWGYLCCELKKIVEQENFVEQ